MAQFEGIEFSEIAPTDTVMELFMPADLGMLYTCPDGSLPSFADMPYTIRIDRISDTSNQCRTWIQSQSSISDYAVVSASQQSITFLAAADPANS